MKNFIKYVVALAVGVIFAFAVVWLKGAFGTLETKACIKIYADAFTAIGLIYVCVGLLIWLGGKGVTDGLAYAFKRLWINLHDKEYREKNKIDYLEYKAARRDKKTPHKLFLIVGGILLIPAAVFIVLFYCI